MSRQSKGRSIANLLNLGHQQIASIINVSSFEDKEDGPARQLIMATQRGIIKKTRLSAYGNPRANGVIAINLDPNDDLIGVAETNGQYRIVLGTRDGMAIKFAESQARSMGRASRGVIGIKLRQGDEVVGMVATEDEDADLFTVCENGYGKRTALDNYRSQSRGGLGAINIKTTDRNGKVVALKRVSQGDDLMLITAKGMIIRTGLDELRSIGRNTQGVRLINLKEGDKLVAAEIIPQEENDVDDEAEKVNGEEES